MANYKLSVLAKEDLIRIHEYGTRNFGAARAEKYFAAFFDRFEEIAQRPYSFEDVSYIASGYRRCVSGMDAIYFRIENGSVEIMSIIGRQDYKP
jgi:toxin ParE1/3/4